MLDCGLGFCSSGAGACSFVPFNSGGALGKFLGVSGFRLPGFCLRSGFLFFAVHAIFFSSEPVQGPVFALVLLHSWAPNLVWPVCFVLAQQIGPTGLTGPARKMPKCSAASFSGFSFLAKRDP